MPQLTFEGDKVRIHWPDVQPYAGTATALTVPSGAAGAMLCALFAKEVAKALAPELIEKTRGGIGREERAQRTAELEQRILSLETEEEALAEAALASGLKVDRRPYASGWALLGLLPGAGQQLEAAK
jgi:hypothetical protein